MQVRFSTFFGIVSVPTNPFASPRGYNDAAFCISCAKALKYGVRRCTPPVVSSRKGKDHGTDAHRTKGG
ncbi:MAG: hypothetical protein NVS2B16_30340 [Chloroflexota bacterium]